MECTTALSRNISIQLRFRYVEVLRSHTRNELFLMLVIPGSNTLNSTMHMSPNNCLNQKLHKSAYVAYAKHIVC